MTIWLKQSTSIDVVVGPFIDDTDGKTVETGLTISQADCLLSKNAASFAQKNSATSASHLTQGMYKVPLNTTDTNTLGMLTLVINESGALPVWADFMVVPANTWDSLFGSDLLDVSVVQIGGSAVSTSTAQLGVNVVSAAGTAWGSGAITAGTFAAGAIDAAAIATDAITSAELASSAVAEVAGAVWDEARSGHTTAGSFGQGVASVQGNVTGSVSGTVGAIGTGGITSSTFGAGAITASAIATDAITAAELSADAVDEILDEVIEGSVTLRQALRILLAAAAGKASGGGTTSVAFRDLADTKNRISATVDASGNRTAVTVDGS